MNEPTMKVIERLQNVKKISSGFSARCPAHDDKRASLSIKSGDDGRVLLKCFAGCETADVVSAIGLTMKDLFADNGKRKYKKKEFKIDKTYDYVNENNELVYQVCKFIPKDFRLRRPDGKDGWIWNLRGVKQVLYRLPQLIESVKQEQIVFIVEGEKDTDNLVKLGLCATCNSAGAGKWKDHYNEYFKGARVVILPDADEPGRRHAEKIARTLYETAQSIRIIELPGLENKQDVSDWLRNGGTKEKLVELCENCIEYELPTEEEADSAGLDEAFEKYGRTDHDLGSMIKDRFGEDIRFAYPDKHWIVWNGKYWNPDDMARINEFFEILTTETFYLAAGKSNDTQYLLMKWLKYIKKQSYRNSALELASKSFSDLKVMNNELNRDNMLLNVKNGTLDLRTGEIRPHNRSDMITRMCDVEYIPGTQSRTWNDFLKTAIPDSDVRRYVQKAAGYSLSGDISEEKLFFAYGRPATGKSTFLSAIQAVLGEYAITSDFSSFLASSNRENKPRPDIAVLSGYRFVTSVEVEDGRHMAEGLLCLLSGGDKVRTRFLNKNTFEFLPTFKIWLAANNRPDVSSGESAIWRRLKLIPFDQVIPEKERDPNVKLSLSDTKKSGAAILAWLVEGCIAWQKERLFPEPDAVKVLTEDYRQESDPLREFIEDNNIFIGNGTTSKQELYDEYLTDCDLKKVKFPIGRKKFNSLIKARGGRDMRISNVRVWNNIELGNKLL